MPLVITIISMPLVLTLRINEYFDTTAKDKNHYDDSEVTRMKTIPPSAIPNIARKSGVKHADGRTDNTDGRTDNTDGR
jgi:hypothetical protein